MKFTFINNPKSYHSAPAYVVHLVNVTSEDQLFAELKSTFKFPDHFGFNWNAVYDCLRDLHWIEQQKVVLVHNELPNLNPAALRMYVQTLLDVMEDWKDGETHSFQVVFPLSVKPLVTIPSHE